VRNTDDPLCADLTQHESCPESNGADLPSHSTLSMPTDSCPGKEIQVKYDNAQENQWGVFVSGLRSVFVPVGKDQKVRDLCIAHSDTKVEDSTTWLTLIRMERLFSIMV
jgi:hypothetical protein